MDAPERIWAGPNGSYWSTEDIGSGKDSPFVRADLYAKVEADLAKVTDERDAARFAERNAESFSSDAIYAVRELLKAHDVPTTAFIDDHVGNAIFQRDEARSENARLAAENERLVEALKQAPSRRHFDILVEAMAEVKATSDGLSDQTVADIIAGCLAEIAALPPRAALTGGSDGE